MTPAVPHTPRIARTALAALVAALLLLATGFAGEARAARGLELAIQDDAIFLSKSPFKNTDKAYSHLRALGVTRLRVNVLWAYSLPKSQYNARSKPAERELQLRRSTRPMIDEAAEHGIRVHASLTGPAPRWATGNRKKLSGFKPNAGAYGEFAAAAAAALQGPGRPLQRLERAELGDVARPDLQPGEPLPRPLRARATPRSRRPTRVPRC